MLNDDIEPEEDEELSAPELAAHLQFRLLRLEAMRDRAARLMQPCSLEAEKPRKSKTWRPSWVREKSCLTRRSARVSNAIWSACWNCR